MIEHIVLLKVTGNDDSVDAALGLVERLPGQVAGLEAAFVGTDGSDRTKGFERAFILKFSSQRALEDWGPHPLHPPIRNVLLSETEMIVFDLHHGDNA